jgi:methylenetetrahydrofolate dehydrogenase (NADP+)/methenyltetrahydrofolate cyclohydrolase
MDIAPPKILDGKIAAAAVQAKCLVLNQYYQKTFNQRVCLGVLCIGDNPASQVYIQRKKAMAMGLGFDFLKLAFPQDTPADRVLRALERSLGQVHGMIVQLPIIPASDATLYLSAIPWDKDVDGLNPRMTGPMTPCTPLGCWLLLQHYGITVHGKNCVIVGRSHLVGRPLAKILLDHHATVTVAHSHTPDLPAVTRKADILFVATGARHLITPDYVSPHSIVIDVGIHRTEQGLTGDVHPDVYPLVQAYSPVPGGVGPMTVISLMWNTLKAAFLQRGMALADEELGVLLRSNTDISLQDLNQIFS